MGIYVKLMAALMLLLVRPVLTGAEKPLQKVVLLTSWKQQAQFAGFYMARELGFYRDMGLEVEIRRRPPDGDIVKMLKDGEADILVATLPEGLVMHDRDPDIISIGQMFQQSSVMVVTRADRGIHRIADLNGKVLASWPGNAALITEILCKEYKLNVDIVHTPSVDELFLWKMVDGAVMMHYHEYFLLLMSGIKPEELTVYSLKDLGLNLPEDGIYCLKSQYNHARSLWYKFNLATVRGWQQAFQEETRTLAVIRSVCDRAGVPFSLSLQRWMIRRLDEVVLAPQSEHSPGILDEEAFYKTAELMVKHSMIRKLPSYRDFYWGPLSSREFKPELARK